MSLELTRLLMACLISQWCCFYKPYKTHTHTQIKDSVLSYRNKYQQLNIYFLTSQVKKNLLEEKVLFGRIQRELQIVKKLNRLNIKCYSEQLVQLKDTLEEKRSFSE